MMKRLDVQALLAHAAPTNSPSDAWYGQAEESVRFLVDSMQRDEVLLHASGPHFLVNSALALREKVTPPDDSDLRQGMIANDDTWCIQKSYGGGSQHRVYLEPPLASLGSSYEGGEMLLFKRFFYGVDKGESRVELSQKLVHSLSLYYVDEREAYCRLDEQGDIEEVICVKKWNHADADRQVLTVSILRKDVDAYMALTQTALVYRFDFTRFRTGSFNGWSNIRREEKTGTDLSYHVGYGGAASYANGYLINRPACTIEGLVEEFKRDLEPVREYATFKIFDRKNNRNVETSCAPDSISNYFQKDDLPWEISPAFFRPDVLIKYKSDPEKYALEDRTISCRNSWFLRGYDINEEGQVHAYIGDLARLPIAEQRYWQSFNEWPKGTISKRAHQSDILGQFTTEHDPLESIRYTVKGLNEAKHPWWSARSDAALSAARYPASKSSFEWANEILHLDQLVVEGFLQKPLRDLAKTAGSEPNAQWGSLKLIEEILKLQGQSPELSASILSPLHDLHNLRNKLKGHATTDSRTRLEKEAQRDFGGFPPHFRHLVTRVEASLRQIFIALGVDSTLIERLGPPDT
jgi:hypothetical protein